jgi:SAM-dependent methyltransferase
MTQNSKKQGEDRNIDAIYYRDGVNNGLAMRALLTARRRMFALFMQKMAPDATTTILDIGVSDDENEGANFLEKLYPWPENITCAGLGDGKAVSDAYPVSRFINIQPGQPLPFPDGHFDIAYSNAVIEHVGGPEQRQRFIAEHLRVARRAFIAFPNRWFPVEHHTNLPLLHFAPRVFRKLLAGTRYDHWVHVRNMDFLDGATVTREWPTELPKPEAIMTTGLPLGPFSSNVAVIARAATTQA